MPKRQSQSPTNQPQSKKKKKGAAECKASGSSSTKGYNPGPLTRSASKLRVEVLETDYGPSFLINADLDNKAKERIKEALKVNKKVKATFKIKISDEVAADMRIDMVGQLERGASHGPARVPHVQIEAFKKKMWTENRSTKTNEYKDKPFTTNEFEAIELTSDMVLETFSEDGKTASIANGTQIYKKIIDTIKDAAKGKSWKNDLFPKGKEAPVIIFSRWGDKTAQ